MISISIGQNSEPILVFNKDVNLTIDQVTAIIFYFKSGTFEQLFKDKLINKLDSRLYNKIINDVHILENQLHKKFDEQILEIAVTPIIGPIQEE